ncbi:MAG TPA: DUF3073 domain-containing protein [Mycobacteriales bacterium]|jgi:hypothetical protein|nr:DUF3073 domain-containing protein [Mycobacteriales bacterium]
MGRGRAKAKQTKVARELKYSGPGMDLNRLQRDLHSSSPASGDPHRADEDERADDPYAAYVDEDEEEGAGSAAS